MSHNLPRTRPAVFTAASLCVAAVVLSACSSGASSDSTSPTSDPRVSTATASAEAGSPTPANSIHLTVGLSMELTWSSQELIDSGEGYGMTLSETSDPDRFDGHFFRREADGAVTDQHVISLFVTSESAIEVTWPDGQVQPGSISALGGDATDIDLAPGCLPYLAAGGTDSDCVLIPESEALVPSPSPATPQALPSLEEAMSYLCSVDVDELSNVVDSSSDPYSTGVLQAALTSLGYDPGPIDGLYGDATSTAVRAFQSAAKLAVDAKVGPRTWTSLQSAACDLPEDPAQPED